MASAAVESADLRSSSIPLLRASAHISRYSPHRSMHATKTHFPSYTNTLSNLPSASGILPSKGTVRGAVGDANKPATLAQRKRHLLRLSRASNTAPSKCCATCDAFTTSYREGWIRKRREEVKKEVEEERTVQGLLRWIERDLGEGWYRETPFEVEQEGEGETMMQSVLAEGLVSELPEADWGCLVERAKKMKEKQNKEGKEDSQVKEINTAKGRKVLWRIDDEDTLEWEFVEDEEDGWEVCTEDGWNVL
ncbi:hypothetical protein BJ508DRAFT_412659 [Ascobolus immersus RN42]|uniref:Uncharacterized protein n=1 Tax=Ascobolus immersus RN42 TaxID=1160509 RepID=A0A3N4IEM6_ASCIM|nr:hypothetical protein BJ508DRAFT_412659 [Ascobolus immersus RN42]